jgi:type 1 glutamine amidotransferase
MLRSIGRAIAAGGLAGWLATAGLCGSAPAQDGLRRPVAATMLRVLILTGQGDHDWSASTPILRDILTGTGRFDVRVCEVTAGLGVRVLEGFDVLVDDAGASGPASAAAGAIAEFVASGKGLVVTHGTLALWAASTPPGGGSPARIGPAPPVAWYPAAFPTGGPHGSTRFCDVKINRPDHAIVRGLPVGFRIADALFDGVVTEPATEVIAVAGGDGARRASTAQPVLLAAARGKGRVFCTALGHDLAAMHGREFIAIFARGTEWAAAGTVTLTADLGAPRPDADAVRALLVTGGHDHESSFYTIFEGHKDLAGIPVTTSAAAFQNDLRGKYDVLVMYDFSRDLFETGKKNLRAFVEGGKGIVVLHHALLNYQDWPWWYDEVVGGSYRLKPEGGAPSSTVKNDQQIFVTPAAAHPITAGIGPFQIVDETYRRMRFSPQARALLTTDNSNSDPWLAWIGPCKTSRVAAIQLGHGPSAFGHPSYRTLVHNAIMWTAGRIQ